MDVPEIFSSAFSTTLGNDVIVVRLLSAALLGAVLGLDREWRNKPAGLKTHMLVSLGAAVFTILALELFHQALQTDDDARPDPVRIVEAMVKGVAFLGAGAIIQGRGGVEGLTTGASAWLAGAIGLAAGTGHIGLAAMTMLLGVGILVVIRLVERRAVRPLRRRHRRHTGRDPDDGIPEDDPAREDENRDTPRP